MLVPLMVQVSVLMFVLLQPLTVQVARLVLLLLLEVPAQPCVCRHLCVALCVLLLLLVMLNVWAKALSVPQEKQGWEDVVQVPLVQGLLMLPQMLEGWGDVLRVRREWEDWVQEMPAQESQVLLDGHQHVQQGVLQPQPLQPPPWPHVQPPFLSPPPPPARSACGTPHSHAA
jgi:hypothetical protein